jgi:hypothetical protein
MRCVCLVAAVLAVGGCDRKKNESGLPPATDWSKKPSVDVDMPSNGGAHAAMGDEGDQAPDQQDPGPATGPMPNDDIHSGVKTGKSMVEQTGLPPPDPNRAIDPTHRISGVIAVDPKVADKVGQQLPVFLAVKRAGADGKPTGLPIAVQKMVWTKAGMAFELTDHDAMVGTGDTLSGEVIVIAHYDQDGDATSKTSGDVIGQATVKIPAENVTLTLDTVIP